jgi:hypothetical protein
MTHEEIAELLGAYALDAVGPDESELIEAHLAGCPRCRDEVAHHREVAAALAFAGASAPEGLWARIAANLETGPPAAELGKLYPLRAARRPWPTRVAAALGAAAAVVIVALGLDVHAQSRRITSISRTLPSQSLQQAAQAALLDPSGSRVQLRSDDHRVFADAVVLRDGTGYLVVNNLPTLASGRTYQLWGVVGDRKISLGVLGTRPSIVAFRASAPIAALAVTDELGGGVVQTAQKPVVVGFLDAAAQPVTGRA